MGILFTKSATNQKSQLVMLGLDGAGKTTILYKLKIGKIETLIPTIGLNIEKLQGKDYDIICWDVGGSDKIRSLWKPFFEQSKGLIYVIDCSNKYRIKEATEELHKLLLDNLTLGFPLLIFVNKQDLSQMSPSDLDCQLNLEKFTKNWYIQPCSAITGEGLKDGLKWIHQQLVLK